jgi:hypothetical protein
MKAINLSAVLVAAAFAGTAAIAQTSPATAAPSPAGVSAAPQNAAPVAINGFVYVDKLPTPTQLTSEAEAEHLTITRMDQSANRIVVVYQYPDGRTRTFAYSTVAPTGNDQVVTAAPANTATATYTMVAPPPAPTTTVVYAQPAPSVVYYDSPRYVRCYDPAWDFWAPLAIGVGLGWGFGGHGGWHGGFHGHGGWHR